MSGDATTRLEREVAAILAHGIDPAPEPDGLVLTALFAAFLSVAAVGVVVGYVIGRVT